MNTFTEQIATLESTGASFREAATRYPEELRRQKPTDIGFSATEIVYHMLDVEQLWQERLTNLFNGISDQFIAMDPDAVAKNNAYNQKDYDAGLSALERARRRSIEFFHSLTDEEFAREGHHTRYGAMSVARILETMTGHDRQHEEQLARTLNEISSRATSEA